MGPPVKPEDDNKSKEVTRLEVSHPFTATVSYSAGMVISSSS
jgi:hypothetical protein